MKKFAILSFAIIFICLPAIPALAVAFELFIPPGQEQTTEADIAYAKSASDQIKWSVSSNGDKSQIVLSLPKVNTPYMWSLDRDTKGYTGLKVEWETVYAGQGGETITVETTGLTETGYYLNLLNTSSGAVVSSATYIYYPDYGVIYIPPEKCLRAAIDEQGWVVGLYNLWGKPVVTDIVYPSYFPAQYMIFTDVKPSYWASQPIHQLLATGFITGYPDHRFKPEGNISRAEFAAVFSRLLAKKYAIGPGYDQTRLFSDLNSSHWAYAAINQMLSYMSNTDARNIFGKRFNPDQNITRGEVTAVVYAVLKDHPNLNYSFLRNFTFSDTENSWVADSASYCANYSFVSGYPDGTFKPRNNITRAEVAAILVKVNEKL